MDNIKIDNLLTEINKSADYTMAFENNFGSSSEYIDYHCLILYLLNDIKIIYKPFNNDRRLRLSGKGNEIIEKGGWLKYIEIEKEKAELNFEKEKYDLLSKKWIYKYRLLPYIISGLALLISILTFIENSAKETKNKKVISEIDSLKTEIQKIQLNNTFKVNKKLEGKLK
jgi:hypothetical protein